MVDSELKDLFFNHHLRKEIEISGNRQGGSSSFKIVNDQIVTESMELTESLCSEGEIKFGTCEASCFKIRVANIDIPIIQDRYINVKINIQETPDSANYKPLQLGKYKVISDKPTADRRWRDITAYDFMYVIINADMLEWYNNYFDDQKTAVTLKQFRHDFLFKGFSIAEYGDFLPGEEEVNLPLDDLPVTKVNGIKKLTGKDILSAIGEINGCFPHINRKGNLTYIFLTQDIHGLYPENTLYPSNDLFPQSKKTNSLSGDVPGRYISANYEDYEVKSIGTLEFRDSTNKALSYERFEIDPANKDVTYVMEDNLLQIGKTKEDLKNYIAQPLGLVIKDIYYRPFEAEVQGNPCFEVGDAISLSTKYQLIESYIMTRTLKGIQKLVDTLSAEGENGDYTTESSSDIQIETSDIQELEQKTEENSQAIQETQEQQKSLSEIVGELENTQRQEVENLKEQIESLNNKIADMQSEINRLKQATGIS